MSDGLRNPKENPTGLGPMRQNVEVKARQKDLDHARQIAKSLSAEHADLLVQVDTYFMCTNGRLKLRETDGQPSCLIWYARADRSEARTSDYCLVPIADSVAMKHALSSALGVRAVVAKRRELYLWHNVRIHLDEVDGIGRFLELEAVLGDAVDERKAHEQVQFLLRELDVSASDIVSGSYVDMR